jgi:hypothetical protein
VTGVAVMLFILTLGTLLGIAGSTLLRQWASEAIGVEARGTALAPTNFPRLAPPTRQPRYPAGYAPSPYLATLRRRRAA